MVVVPAGSFVMGSPPSEAISDKSERPQHTVTIARPLAVSRYELTFDEWDACVAYGDCDSRVSDSGMRPGHRSVINVTWDNAKQYVSWLARVTGKPLPAGHRGRIRVCDARRHDDGLSLGQRHRREQGQLQRLR
jgi:formylglycine-generating enzyme required for sulfatase activity